MKITKRLIFRFWFLTPKRKTGNGLSSVFPLQNENRLCTQTFVMCPLSPRILIGSHRDAAPLTPHPRQDVGRTAGAPTHLTPGCRRQVPLPPVVVKRILEQQKVNPASEWLCFDTRNALDFLKINSANIFQVNMVEKKNKYLHISAS